MCGGGRGGGAAESSGEQGGGNEGEGVTAALMVFGLIPLQVQAGVLQVVCGACLLTANAVQLRVGCRCLPLLSPEGEALCLAALACAHLLR